VGGGSHDAPRRGGAGMTPRHAKRSVRSKHRIRHSVRLGAVPSIGRFSDRSPRPPRAPPGAQDTQCGSTTDRLLRQSSTAWPGDWATRESLLAIPLPLGGSGKRRRARPPRPEPDVVHSSGWCPLWLPGLAATCEPSTRRSEGLHAKSRGLWSSMRPVNAGSRRRALIVATPGPRPKAAARSSIVPAVGSCRSGDRSRVGV
jgi:hypothetical protein